MRSFREAPRERRGYWTRRDHLHKLYPLHNLAKEIARLPEDSMLPVLLERQARQAKTASRENAERQSKQCVACKRRLPCEEFTTIQFKAMAGRCKPCVTAFLLADVEPAPALAPAPPSASSSPRPSPRQQRGVLTE